MTASIESKVATLTRWSKSYRLGQPEVTDAEYDQLLSELREVAPDHPYLQTVEPEAVGSFGAPVRHSSPMLSTDKAYTQADVDAWIAAVRKQGAALGIHHIKVRVTPKLDGLAAFWDGQVLATRGDGTFGQDVTRCLARGVRRIGADEGPGELVIEQAYFEQHLRRQHGLAHPRNFMVGLVAADTIKPHHQPALDAGVCHFVSYAAGDYVEMSLEVLESTWQSVMVGLRNRSAYATDGVVVEVIDPHLRDAMGATSHHHRWMLALKESGESAEATVESVTLQVGRGRITPVLEITPTQLSGATIRRVTAHHAGHLRRSGLGPGARIRIVRAGEVIPYCSEVLSPSTMVVDLSSCPSCGTATTWDNDFLLCPNTLGCPAQAASRHEHFFMRLGIKGFGPKVCEQLADKSDSIGLLGYNTSDFVAAGISPGIAANLVDAIIERRATPVRDTDAVASLGIHGFGRGDSRKILELYPWQALDTLTEQAIERISGFGEQSAKAIAPHLAFIRKSLQQLEAYGFTIEPTIRPADTADSPIKGKKLVFTGAMELPRGDMEQRARELGATIQSSISATTDLLVVGEKAGSKLAKAQSLGVRVMPVNEYLQLIATAA